MSGPDKAYWPLPATIRTYSLLAILWLATLTAAADLNNILMLKSPECNNYGDQMACTDVPIDFCCSAAMPFCHIAVDNKANIPEITTSAWANTNTCHTNAPPPLYCREGFCACLDASTPRETDATCAALWSSTRKEYFQGAGRVPERGCRLADTLSYTDPDGRRREIKGITEANFAEVVGHYNAGNYSHLAALVVV